MRVRAADIKAGDYVIVQQFIDNQQGFGDDQYAGYFRGMREQKQGGLVGVPLLVVAVNIPFIAVMRSPAQEVMANSLMSVSFFGSTPGPRLPTSLNTDEVHLILANEEFAQAFFPPPPVKSERTVYGSIVSIMPAQVDDCGEETKSDKKRKK